MRQLVLYSSYPLDVSAGALASLFFYDGLPGFSKNSPGSYT